jgi:hypothetical protein
MKTAIGTRKQLRLDWIDVDLGKPTRPSAELGPRQNCHPAEPYRKDRLALSVLECIPLPAAVESGQVNPSRQAQNVRIPLRSGSSYKRISTIRAATCPGQDASLEAYRRALRRPFRGMSCRGPIWRTQIFQRLPVWTKVGRNEPHTRRSGVEALGWGCGGSGGKQDFFRPISTRGCERTSGKMI